MVGHLKLGVTTHVFPPCSLRRPRGCSPSCYALPLPYHPFPLPCSGPPPCVPLPLPLNLPFSALSDWLQMPANVIRLQRRCLHMPHGCRAATSGLQRPGSLHEATCYLKMLALLVVAADANDPGSCMVSNWRTTCMAGRGGENEREREGESNTTTTII